MSIDNEIRKAERTGGCYSDDPEERVRWLQLQLRSGKLPEKALPFLAACGHSSAVALHGALPTPNNIREWWPQLTVGYLIPEHIALIINIEVLRIALAPPPGKRWVPLEMDLAAQCEDVIACAYEWMVDETNLTAWHMWRQHAVYHISDWVCSAFPVEPVTVLRRLAAIEFAGRNTVFRDIFDRAAIALIAWTFRSSKI